MRIGLALLALGGLLAALAIGLYAHTAAFVASAVRADGTVLELVPHRSTTSHGNRQRTSTVFHPRVRFEADGRTYTFEDQAGSAPPAFDVGEHVTVLYAPGHPDDAMVDSWIGRYLGPLILGIFALIALGIGTGLTIAGLRGRARRALSGGDTIDWPDAQPKP